MKIRIPVSELRDVVSTIAPMAGRNRPIGVSAINGRIILVATGEYVSIEAMIDCVVEQNGSTFLPSDTTPSALSTMPSTSEVTISTHDTHVSLSCGGILMSFPTEDGSLAPPHDPDGEAVELDGGGLSLCISRVQEYAKKHVQTGFTLECVRLEVKDRFLYAVAIGFGGAAMGIAGTPARSEASYVALISREASLLMVRMLSTGPCKIWFSESSVTVRCGCYRIELRQVAGKYPDWSSMVPPKKDAIEVPSEDLILAMRQVNLLGEERDCVHFHLLPESLTMSRVSPGGKIVREIPIARQERIAECDVSHQKLMPSLLHAPKGKPVKLYIPDPEEAAMHVIFEGARFYVATMA